MKKITTVKLGANPLGVIQGKPLGNNLRQIPLFLATFSGAGVAQFALNSIPKFESITSITPYVPADAPDGYSKLGTPVYGKIVLGNQNGDNTYTNQQGKQGNFNTVELDCAIVTVDFNSTIIKTDIQGLAGSIKEFISSGDNDITITGRYDSTPGVAPRDFNINLAAMFNAPITIPVTNYFLNDLGIYYIVIMPGTSLPQQAGGYAYQEFTIKAVSDNPIITMFP